MPTRPDQESLPDLAAVIKQALYQGESAGLKYYHAAGVALRKAKKQLAVKGEWLKWLKSLEINPRRAQRYMKLARLVPKNDAASHPDLQAAWRKICGHPPAKRQPKKRSPAPPNVPGGLTIPQAQRKEYASLLKKLKQKFSTEEDAETVMAALRYCAKESSHD